MAFFEGVVCAGKVTSESDSFSSARFLLGVWPELLEEVIAMVGPAFSFQWVIGRQLISDESLNFSIYSHLSGPCLVVKPATGRVGSQGHVIAA